MNVKIDAELDVVVPDAPPIDGLAFRRFRHASDYGAIADLIVAGHFADGDEYLPDAALLEIDFEHTEGFDRGRDLLLAEVGGRLVGYGMAHRQLRAEVAVYITNGMVHPAYRRRGLGRAILGHNESRLREIAAGHEDAGGREFGAWIGDREAGVRELLEGAGYRPVRRFFAMIRGNLDTLPEAPVPDGIELRSLAPENWRAVHDASNEAFRDHWDHHEATEADFGAFFKVKDLAPDLSRIAWEGDEVAGSVITFVWTTENEKLGVHRAWLERVSVRRPWRRRGLARAMIVSSLAAIREAGLDAALLGVDSESLTGALALYESLGFTVHDTGTAFRKAW
jgi:mycothiol synthase